MAIVVVFGPPVGVPLAEALELEEALPLEPVLKNHSVSFRSC